MLIFLLSFPRKSLPKWRKLVVFFFFPNWHRYSMFYFTNMNQCMLLISRDSLTNPWGAQSTCQTRVNSQTSVRIPSSSYSKHSLYFQNLFFFTSLFTPFSNRAIAISTSRSAYFMVHLKKIGFLEVWRKVKPSWKEVETSLPPDSPDSSRNQLFLSNFLLQGLLFFFLTLRGFHWP